VSAALWRCLPRWRLPACPRQAPRGRASARLRSMAHRNNDEKGEAGSELQASVTVLLRDQVSGGANWPRQESNGKSRFVSALPVWDNQANCSHMVDNGSILLKAETQRLGSGPHSTIPQQRTVGAVRNDSRDPTGQKRRGEGLRGERRRRRRTNLGTVVVAPELEVGAHAPPPPCGVLRFVSLPMPLRWGLRI